MSTVERPYAVMHFQRHEAHVFVNPPQECHRCHVMRCFFIQAMGRTALCADCHERAVVAS